MFASAYAMGVILALRYPTEAIFGREMQKTGRETDGDIEMTQGNPGGSGVIFIRTREEKHFLTDIGAGEWMVPTNWADGDNEIHTIGGGSGTQPDGPGHGGGWSKEVNVRLTPGAKLPFHVGSGGTIGRPGGDTWFGHASYASSIVAAKGGSCEHGGQADEGIGTYRMSGEDGEGMHNV